MIVESVDIDGFWGSKKASAKFYSDVTIFIGFNGTGKSTFVNLIAATLSLDIVQLSTLQFEQVRIKLTDTKNNKQRTIQVKKEIIDDQFGVAIYEYKISNKSYRIFTDRCIAKKYRMSNIYAGIGIPSSMREEQIKLKEEMANLVEVSQISVYRQSYDDDIEIDPRQRVSAVDERLRLLFDKFAKYQLKLETKLNEISKNFQQDTVSSLLYNNKFDKFELKSKELNKIDLTKLRKNLYLAFEELGIKDQNKNLENHIDRIIYESAMQTSSNYRNLCS